MTTSSWVNRVKSRMKELNMTQEDLAKKMGLTRGAITHYLAGRRVPPLQQFHKLAVVLKTSPAWLQFGISDISKKVSDKIPKAKEQLNMAQIPILSWEQAAECTKIQSDEIKEFVPNFYTDKLRWYGLRVKGDSMSSPLGHQKSFHEGDIIIIDPEKNAAHGDYVIALLPRSKEVTFKQYVIDGGVRYLKPLNPQYPTTQINDSTHICGVVTTCLSHKK